VQANVLERLDDMFVDRICVRASKVGLADILEGDLDRGENALAYKTFGKRRNDPLVEVLPYKADAIAVCVTEKQAVSAEPG